MARFISRIHHAMGHRRINARFFRNKASIRSNVITAHTKSALFERNISNRPSWHPCNFNLTVWLFL